MAQAKGPLKRIRDNAYKLELLGDMHVSATFNVGSLAPYVQDDLKDLTENLFQEGENDVYQAPSKLWDTTSSTPKSNLTFLDHDGHRSNISLSFSLSSHHLSEV